MYSSNAPRTVVRVNGQPVIPKSWDIERNSQGELDSATVVLPVVGNPDWNKSIKAGQALEVRIYAGFPSEPDPFNPADYAQLKQRFAGTADPISAKFDSDECTLTCMDFGGILARTRTTTNLGAFGINAALNSVTTTRYLKDVAAAHGFTVNIVPPGFQGASIQQVMAHEQVVGLHAIRIWDLLKYCADTDGMYLWTHDGVINYVDADSLQRPIIYFTWLDGVNSPTDFELQHSPEFSKDVEVECRSYIPRLRFAVRSRVGSHTDSNGNTVQVWRKTSSSSVTRQNFGQPGSVTSSTEHFDGGSSNGTTVSGDSTSTGSTISVGGPVNTGYTNTPSDSAKVKYIFKLPNATLPQCQAYAMKKWKEISSHEYTATFSFPVSPARLNDLDITTKFVIDKLPWGSGNQSYILKRLSEHYSMIDGESGGYYAEAIAINHRLPFGSV